MFIFDGFIIFVLGFIFVPNIGADNNPFNDGYDGTVFTAVRDNLNCFGLMEIRTKAGLAQSHAQVC